MRKHFIFILLLFLIAAAAASADEIRLQSGSQNAYYPDGYKGIQETEIYSINPDANMGSNWDMIVGTDEKDGIHRLLFRWNIKELAPLFTDKNKMIISIKMRLGEWYTKNVANQKFEVFRILPANKDWVVGTIGINTWETLQAGSATWKDAISGSKPWAGETGCGKAGVDYDIKPVSDFRADNDTRGMRPRYLEYFDLPIDLVKSWAINPEQNAGLLVKAAVEKGDRLTYIIGSEHQRADFGWNVHHPELVISYIDRRNRIMKASSYIVKSGKPACVIITPKDSTASERYAAEELASHIKQITGVDLIQLSENKYKPEIGAYISVGKTKAVSKIIDKKQFAAFGDEGYKVFSKNGNMYVVGGAKRGSLYAVYDYLESLGVKWYSPDYTVIPKKSSIKMPAAEIAYKPTFWYRDQYWDNGTTKEWLARMRQNGQYAGIPDDMGGSAHTAYGCHSFFALIPPEEYFDKHPEWFATKDDGKHSTTEYCLTNPELREFVKNRVLKELKESEGWAEYFWVSQNDGSLSGCFCDKCRAEREAHGAKDRWSANTISFVNYVANAVAKEFPKVKIKTLAYSYTTEPPANMKVADNVVIELCGNYGPGKNDKHSSLTKSWSKIAKNIEVYTYGGSNFGYWWPYPNMWEMGAQYTRALNSGVTAFYVQGTAVGKGSGMVDLRAYLSARLAWNPSRNVKKETKDFCNGFYGPGGKYIYEYENWYAAYTAKHKMKVDGGWGNPDLWKEWVNKETMDYSDALFQKALEATKDNKIYYNHVRRAYLEVLWGTIMVNLAKKPQILDGKYVMIPSDKYEDIQKRAKLFAEIMAENGYNMMSEPVPYIAGQSQIDAVSNNYPAVNLKNPGCSMWIVPSLGGRIILWNVDALGGGILRVSGGSDPLSAGYEELSEIPVKTAKYEIISSTDKSVSMKGKINDQVESTRTFALDPEKTLLNIVSEYKNISDKPVSFAIRTHPEFAFKVFGKSSLYYVNKDGNWNSMSVWTPKNREGSNYIEASTVGKGIWLFGDTERNTGIINRFDPSVIKTMYTYHGETYGGMNLELWSKQITLQPGETWKLDHSYEVSTDIKSVIK